MKKMKSLVSLQLSVLVSKQGKRFVAYSPALDLSTLGKTEKLATEKFQEIAQIFFEELFERGDAQEVLSELGWKKTRSQWVPPKSISQNIVGIQVPTFA